MFPKLIVRLFQLEFTPQKKKKKNWYGFIFILSTVCRVLGQLFRIECNIF